MRLYDLIRDNKLRYSPSIVRDLISSNRNKFGYVKPQTKRLIFFMVRRIVMRGILSFHKINTNRQVTEYDIDDLTTEMYLVLSNCCDKFDTTKNKDFYLYFNSAVTNRVRRISNGKTINHNEDSFSVINDRITGSHKNLNIEGILEDKHFQEHFNLDVFFKDIESMDLSEEELKMVNVIINTSKKSEIMGLMGYTEDDYKKGIEKLKSKIQKKYINEC